MLVITGLGVGGAERQVVDLADAFASAGHAVHILTLTGPIALRPRDPSVGITCMGVRKSPWGLWRACMSFRSAVRDFHPDVVHSHMRHANVFSRLMRRGGGVPRLICTSHTSNDGGWFWMRLYRWTDPLCDLTTSVSEAATRCLIARGAVGVERSLTVYNGIDVRRYLFDPEARVAVRHDLGVTEDQKVFIAIGRLTAAKDYPNLLAAFSGVVREESNVVLWIVGAGPLEDSLKKLAAEYGLKDRCKFLGLRLDTGALLSASDLFVLSSEWEGFGLVAAEAMVCGRPVVATDAFGVREVIGEYGVLVPPKNSEELALAMKSALHMDTRKQSQITQKAHDRVLKNFSMDSVCERWLSIYRNLK